MAAMEVGNPMSLQMTSTRSQIIATDFPSFYSKRPFFDSTDGVPRVAGDGRAITALYNAINIQGQSVDAENYTNSGRAFRHCLDYWQRQDALPQSDDPVFELGQWPSEQLELFGITAEDFLIDYSESIRCLTSPPMLCQDVNLDYGLAFLRVMTKYHNAGSPDGPRVYQIGVVTRVDNENYAPLFNSLPGSKPTHTAWMLRQIIGDPRGDYGESWHGFTIRPGVPEPAKEIFRPAPSVARPSRAIAMLDGVVRKGLWSVKSNVVAPPATFVHESQGTPTATANKSTTKKKARQKNRLQHHGMPISDYQNLSVDEILDGAIDPDELAGEVLLEVNKHYTYQEITERLNVVRKSLGRAPTKRHNTWKRVKSALEVRATSEKSFESLKDEIDEQRKANMATRKGAKWYKSRWQGMRRKEEGKEKETEEENDLQGFTSDEDSDHIEQLAAPTTRTRATRRASTKTNYVFEEESDSESKHESFQDGDDGEEHEHQGFVKAGWNKRRRTVKLEESDGDESEYHDGD